MKTPYGKALDELERIRELLLTIKAGVEAHDIERAEAPELRELLGRIHRDVSRALQ